MRRRRFARDGEILTASFLAGAGEEKVLAIERKERRHTGSIKIFELLEVVRPCLPAGRRQTEVAA